MAPVQPGVEAVATLRNLFPALLPIDRHDRSDSFASKIAVTTAIMATLGALLSYQAGSSESLAAMDKSATAANVDQRHPQAETGHAAIEHCTESVLIKP